MPPAARMEYAGKPLLTGAQCTMASVQAAGLNCTADDPCALFLELAAVELIGDRLLVTGNLHTSSATLETILLASEDLGRTWTEAHPRIPSAVLDQVQFLDFELGWISGHVLEKQPRDAFFLLTRDGGRTWLERPVYGEPHPGAIEQFWFDSRTHGTMLFDKGQGGETGMRHELYESMTGGEGWSLRQVDSKPIALKKPPATAPAWRLRPDNRLKAYVVERNAANRWQPVASFAIAAGECKPPPPPEPEPDKIEEPTLVAEPEVSKPFNQEGTKPRRPPTLKKK